MPIVFIQQMSPLRVGIKDDQGNVLAECEAETVDCESLDWVVDRAARSPGHGRPPRGKPFRMKDRTIELRTDTDREGSG